MHHFLEASLPQYIRTVLQPAYARRYRALMSAVVEYLVPLGVVVPAPDTSGIGGGYFVWLKLPSGIDAELVARKASDEEALVLPPGSTFQSMATRGTIRTCLEMTSGCVLRGLKKSFLRRVSKDWQA